MLLKKKKNSLKEEIDNFILTWNNKFPIDKWWREKYKVAFGSQQHKDMNFILMFIDYEEEKVFKKIEDAKNPDNAETFDTSRVVKMSKKEIDEDFDNLDISKMNTKQEV